MAADARLDELEFEVGGAHDNAVGIGKGRGLDLAAVHEGAVGGSQVGENPRAGLVLADFRMDAGHVDVGNDDIVLRLAPDGLCVAGKGEGTVVGDVVDIGLARFVVGQVLD